MDGYVALAREAAENIAEKEEKDYFLSTRFILQQAITAEEFVPLCG